MSVPEWTQHTLDELRRHYGPRSIGRVIYNGSSASPAVQSPREPFILSAGRLWDEAKNIQLLAQIVDRVRWPIRVAGDAEHPNGCGRVDWGNLQMLG